MATSGEAASPEQAELLAELESEHERLRVRVLELLKLMEDEVTEKVEAEFRAEEAERRAADWEIQAAALQRELQALRNTKLMRIMAPVRAAYGKVRRRG